MLGSREARGVWWTTQERSMFGPPAREFALLRVPPFPDPDLMIPMSNGAWAMSRLREVLELVWDLAGDVGVFVPWPAVIIASEVCGMETADVRASLVMLVQKGRLVVRSGEEDGST